MSYTPLATSTALSKAPDIHNENARKARHLNISSKSADFTVSAGESAGSPHDVYHCDATSAAVTGTLPAVADADVGRIYYAMKTDAGGNAVGFDGNGSETINGSTGTYSTTTRYERVCAYTDGTEWFGFKLSI